jgi:hypothetical protein
MCNKNEVERCVYYKSKNGIKNDSIVYVSDAPLDISIVFGNQNDATIAINRISIIANKINAEKYKNSQNI